ncbi:hypothetical protein QBC37DRAFT_464136 [Rhypophila decipiens]|uniref:Uncharacterized protein n=1 Tax=Rhypophila decipiens TaxID=261697 RepID=A0AAN7B9P5_9PEZI|nr:hypothetical protein QBC37DRAFT_464136 [Rhypophila decipiens]
MPSHFRITQVVLWTAIYTSLILAAPFGSSGPPAAAAFDFQYRIFLRPNRQLEPNDPSPEVCIPNEDKGDNLLLPHTFSAQSGQCVSLSDVLLKPASGGGSQSTKNKIDSLELMADQIRNGRATLMTFCGETCDQEAVVHQTTGRTCYSYYELPAEGGEKREE